MQKKRKNKGRELIYSTLLEADLGGCLHGLIAHILEVVTVNRVGLLLDSASKLAELIGDLHSSIVQHINQRSTKSLLVYGEERMRRSGLSSTTGTSNTMDIVLYRQRECHVDHMCDACNINTTSSHIRSHQ